MSSLRVHGVAAPGQAPDEVEARRRRRGRAVLAEGDFAVDAVDAEQPLAVLAGVVTDDVPAAVAERDAPHVQFARSPR